MSLNRPQALLLGFGVLACCAAAICPPWVASLAGTSDHHMREYRPPWPSLAPTFAGYGPARGGFTIFAPPELGRYRWRVDFDRLFIALAVIASGTGLGLLVLRSRKPGSAGS